MLRGYFNCDVPTYGFVKHVEDNIVFIEEHIALNTLVEFSTESCRSNCSGTGPCPHPTGAA
eukprot:12680174-Prorocentrum_lima.AAC.1